MSERLSTSHGDDPAKGFLNWFEASRRSGVANLFHESVRRGASSPKDVVADVEAVVRRRAVASATWARQSPGARADADRDDFILRMIREHRPEALAYAQHVYDWELLPQPERDRQKEERAGYYRVEFMRTKPVTEKQIKFLKALGYTGPEPADRAEASRLIDEFKQAIDERVDTLDAELDRQLAAGPEAQQ